MIGINNLEVSNFRGLRNLKFSRFGRVNIFLGENNVGKTSILEAIFMLTGMSNPIIPVRMNSFRDEKLRDVPSLKYYFYNTNFRNTPVIKGESSDRKKRQIEFAPEFGMSQLKDDLQLKSSGASLETLPLSGLTIRFKNGSNSYVGRIIDGDSKISIDHDDKYTERIKTVFIPSTVKDGNAIDSYSELVKRQKKSEIIEMMQYFDPRIVSLEALSDGLYIQYEGLDELYPIALSGDGTRRFFNIVSFVADPTTDIVMIDEIETGVHFSAYKKLWKSILTYVMKSDVQVFVTTHSKETLACLSQILQEEAEFDNEDLQVFSLKRYLDGELEAYPITTLGLQGALENHIELR